MFWILATPVGKADTSLWIWFAFPWWLVTSIFFSNICGPLIFLPLRIVYEIFSCFSTGLVGFCWASEFADILRILILCQKVVYFFLTFWCFFFVLSIFLCRSFWVWYAPVCCFVVCTLESYPGIHPLHWCLKVVLGHFLQAPL